MVERVVPCLGLLVDERRMALAERAARAVLPGQAHRIALGQQRSERQRLGRGPVEPGAAVEHLRLAVHQALYRAVEVEVGGCRDE